jgi:lysophospholipase L1-like esterase
MVGPLPVGDAEADARVAALSAAFAALCAPLEVPYLEVFHLAANSDGWAREVAAGDGAHPNALGYTLIGEAFQRWSAWQAWHGPARESVRPDN